MKGGAIVLAVIAPLAAGCLGTTNKERAEIAQWEDCTDRAIAALRDPKGRLKTSGRTAYFEATYRCRELFPDLDKAGKTTVGRQLLNRLYRRTVLSPQTDT